MRVVAGTHRGRRIDAPPGDVTRPTSDRVREAMFNALGSLGAVEGATFLDLFAGSGALGIEAISRGAESVVFVERDRASAATVRSNLATLGCASSAEVVCSDAWSWLASPYRTTFDVALLDPPYRFDEWDRLMSVLPANLAVLESDRAVDVPDGWVSIRHRRYGSTFVTIVGSATSSGDI